MKNDQRKSKPGFTLIESLISLSLSTLIILSCLEFFSHTRVLFTKLKEKFQTTESVFFTLDKIRFDLQCSGQGLLNPINLEILEPFSITDDSFMIFSREKEIKLEDDLVPGQTHIQLKDIKGLKKDRLLCIFDHQRGEINKIAGIDNTGIALSSQIENSYHSDSATMLLVRTIFLYLDKKDHILRRKVNSSPAQPLLEDIHNFKGFYRENSRLIFIQIQMNQEEDKFYEISFVPKNSTMASNHRSYPPPV
ncbi:MAG: hypothetical protein JW755_07050 [Candidatus Aminicenantes bacterium]|nr:hypothetical protein [Candidatus Aminicenantes bacterium]